MSESDLGPGMSRYKIVDLMSDCARYTAGEVERVVVIVKTADGHFRVIEDGKMADGLVFDEMIGQIVELFHPRIESRCGIPMKTREQIAAENARRRAVGEPA